MAGNGAKETYSMRARIDAMDNGATMHVYKHAKLDGPGVLVMRKVYTDFDALAKDLREIMKFNFSDVERKR